MGIVIFAITVGVGVTVLGKFSVAVADCGVGNATGETLTYNATDKYCYNATGIKLNPGSDAAQTTTSLEGDMGTSGLAGWTGAIVALAVGLLFIGALMGRRQS